MKHAANLITLARIVLVLGSVMVYLHPYWFVTLYLLAGLTDVLDGYVARITHTQSELGARLDTIADLFLFGVVLIVMMLWLRDDALVLMRWIIIVGLLRMINLLIAVRKYGSLAILHTWGNKLTGLLLFLAPLLFVAFQVRVLWLVCVVAALSAIEEGVIHLVSEELNLNRQSLFMK